jgi:L-ribulose-5-phosphate 4-epimerase
MLLLKSLRQEIVDHGVRLVEFGLVKGRAGNISALDAESGYLAISPSRMYYNRISPKDIVILDKDGNIIDGKQKPSSEFNSHLAIYQQRFDVHSIIHTHSPSAIAFSLIGKEVDLSAFSENLVEQKTIPIVPKALPGTNELANHLRLVFQNPKINVCLISGHGVFVVGSTVSIALARACFVEEALQALIFSKILQLQ